MNKELIDMINKFSDEFISEKQQEMPVNKDEDYKKTYINLTILKLIAEGKKNKEIKLSMQVYKGLKANSWERKIRRIRKQCTEVYQLPNLIKIKSLVKFILEKYPSPMLVGFPFEYWTCERIKRYICLYFNIYQISGLSEELKPETIQRYMDDYNINHCTFQKILYQLLNEQKNYEFYYLMVIKIKYYHIPYYNTANKRYEALYYANLFHLIKGIPEDTGYSMAVSIVDPNKRKLGDSLKSLLVKIKNDIPVNRKLVIFSNLGGASKSAIISYYNVLEEIPDFQWLVFNKCEEICVCLNNIKSVKTTYEDYKNGFIALQNVELKSNNIGKRYVSYDSFIDEKKDYVLEIKKNISEQIE